MRTTISSKDGQMGQQTETHGNRKKKLTLELSAKEK